MPRSVWGRAAILHLSTVSHTWVEALQSVHLAPAGSSYPSAMGGMLPLCSSGMEREENTLHRHTALSTWPSSALNPQLKSFLCRLETQGQDYAWEITVKLTWSRALFLLAVGCLGLGGCWGGRAAEMRARHSCHSAAGAHQSFSHKQNGQPYSNRWQTVPEGKRSCSEAFNCSFKPWAPKSREGAGHHVLWDMNSPFSQDSLSLTCFSAKKLMP